MSLGTQIDFNDRDLLSWGDGSTHSQSIINYRNMIITETNGPTDAQVLMYVKSSDPNGRIVLANFINNNTNGNKASVTIPISTNKYGSTVTSDLSEVLVEFNVRFSIKNGAISIKDFSEATGGELEFFSLTDSLGINILSLGVDSSGINANESQFLFKIDSFQIHRTTAPFLVRESDYRINIYYKASSGPANDGIVAVWINGDFISSFHISGVLDTSKVSNINIKSHLISKFNDGSGFWNADTDIWVTSKYVACINSKDYVLIDKYENDINRVISESQVIDQIFLDEAYIALNGDATQNSFVVNVHGNPDGFRNDWRGIANNDIQCRLEYRKKGDSLWSFAQTITLFWNDAWNGSLTAIGVNPGTIYEWRVRFHEIGIYDINDPTTYHEPLATANQDFINSSSDTSTSFTGETCTLDDKIKDYNIMFVGDENQSGIAGNKVAYKYALDRGADVCFHLGDKLYSSSNPEGFGPASNVAEFYIAYRAAIEDRWFCTFARKKPVYHLFDDRDFGENNWDASYRRGYDPATGLDNGDWGGKSRSENSIAIPSITKDTLYDSARIAWYNSIGSNLLNTNTNFGLNKDWFNNEQYRSFETFRLKFIFLDARSFKDANGTQPTSFSDPLNPDPFGSFTPTRLGTKQKEWLNSIIQNNNKDFTFLMSTSGWTDAAAGEDSWNSNSIFINERNDIANTFQSTNVGKMGIISGDTHIPMVIGPSRFSNTFGHANTSNIIFETIASPLSERFSNNFDINKDPASNGKNSNGVIHYSNLGGMTNANWIRSYGMINIKETTGKVSITLYNAETNVELYAVYSLDAMQSSVNIPTNNLQPINLEDFLGAGTSIPGTVGGSANKRKWWHSILSIEDQNSNKLQALTTIDPSNINSNVDDVLTSARYHICGSSVAIPPAAFDNNDAFSSGLSFFAEGGRFIFRPNKQLLSASQIEINSRVEAENVNNRRIFKYYVLPAYNEQDTSCSSLVPNSIDTLPVSLTTNNLTSFIFKLPLIPIILNIGCCKLNVNIPNIDPYTGLPIEETIPGPIAECTRLYYILRNVGTSITYNLFSFDIESNEIVNRGDILWQESSSDIFFHDLTWDNDNILWGLYDGGIRMLTIGDSTHNSFALDSAVITTSGPILDLFPILDNNITDVGRSAMAFNQNNSRLYIYAKNILWEFQKVSFNSWELIKKSSPEISTGGVRDIAFSSTNTAYGISNNKLATIDIISSSGRGFGRPKEILTSDDFLNVSGLDFVASFGFSSNNLTKLYATDDIGNIFTVDEVTGKIFILPVSLPNNIIGLGSCIVGENIKIPPQPWNPGINPWILMIDASGSMSGARIQQLKEAFNIFINNVVMPGDFLTIMTFGASPIGTDVIPTGFGGYWGPYAIDGVPNNTNDDRSKAQAINIVNSIIPAGIASFCEAFTFIRDNGLTFGGTNSIAVFSNGAFSGASGCSPVPFITQSIVDNICAIWQNVGTANGHSPEAKLQSIGMSPDVNGEFIMRGISDTLCGGGGYTLWIP